VAGEDRYQYELREGQHLANGSIVKAGTSESISGELPSNDWFSIRRAAQKKCRRAVLAGQWAACMRLLRSRRLDSGNEFGSPNKRWSRPRGAFRGRLGPGVGSDVLSAAARLLNIIVRRIVPEEKGSALNSLRLWGIIHSTSCYSAGSCSVCTAATPAEIN